VVYLVKTANQLQRDRRLDRARRSNKIVGLGQREKIGIFQITARRPQKPPRASGVGQMETEETTAAEYQRRLMPVPLPSKSQTG